MSDCELEANSLDHTLLELEAREDPPTQSEAPPRRKYCSATKNTLTNLGNALKRFATHSPRAAALARECGADPPEFRRWLALQPLRKIGDFHRAWTASTHLN
jgi:hypothetical protein